MLIQKGFDDWYFQEEVEKIIYSSLKNFASSSKKKKFCLCKKSLDWSLQKFYIKTKSTHSFYLGTDLLITNQVLESIFGL